MKRFTAGFALLQLAFSQQYQLIQEYTAANFFDEFRLFSGLDPTGGFVQYEPFETAASTGLIGNGSGLIYLGVDHTNVYTPGGPGRPSVRLESKMTFTEGLFVIDLTHMPVGCGTWPAFWTAGLGDWPTDGEIDIIENVNDARTNNAALHATGDCSVDGFTGQTSTWKSTDCNIVHDENEGCGTDFTEPYNYGAEFNANGGGVYVMEWTSSKIDIWFFPATSVPYELTDPEHIIPDSATFGTPSASFSGPCSSSFGEKFFNHSLIIDTTFCGGWAGGTFGSGASACPISTGASPIDSCVSYVASNPQAFTEAYWAIKSLSVWQKVQPLTLPGLLNQTLATPWTWPLETPEPVPVDVSSLTGGVLTISEDLSGTSTVIEPLTQSLEVATPGTPGPLPVNVSPLTGGVLTTDEDLNETTTAIELPEPLTKPLEIPPPETFAPMPTNVLSPADVVFPPSGDLDEAQAAAVYTPEETPEPQLAPFLAGGLDSNVVPHNIPLDPGIGDGTFPDGFGTLPGAAQAVDSAPIFPPAEALATKGRAQLLPPALPLPIPTPDVDIPPLLALNGNIGIVPSPLILDTDNSPPVPTVPAHNIWDSLGSDLQGQLLALVNSVPAPIAPTVPVAVPIAEPVAPVISVVPLIWSAPPIMPSAAPIMLSAPIVEPIIPPLISIAPIPGLLPASVESAAPIAETVEPAIESPLPKTPALNKTDTSQAVSGLLGFLDDATKNQLFSLLAPGIQTPGAPGVPSREGVPLDTPASASPFADILAALVSSPLLQSVQGVQPAPILQPTTSNIVAPVPAPATVPLQPVLPELPLAQTLSQLDVLPVQSDLPLTPPLNKTDTSQAVGGILGFLDDTTKNQLFSLLAPVVEPTAVPTPAVPTTAEPARKEVEDVEPEATIGDTSHLLKDLFGAAPVASTDTPPASSEVEDSSDPSSKETWDALVNSLSNDTKTKLDDIVVQVAQLDQAGIASISGNPLDGLLSGEFLPIRDEINSINTEDKKKLLDWLNDGKALKWNVTYLINLASDGDDDLSAAMQDVVSQAKSYVDNLNQNLLGGILGSVKSALQTFFPFSSTTPSQSKRVKRQDEYLPLNLHDAKQFINDFHALAPSVQSLSPAEVGELGDFVKDPRIDPNAKKLLLKQKFGGYDDQVKAFVFRLWFFFTDIYPSLGSEDQKEITALLLDEKENSELRLRVRQTGDDYTAKNVQGLLEQRLQAVCPSPNLDNFPTTELVADLENPAANLTLSLASFQAKLLAYIGSLQACSEKVNEYAQKLKQFVDDKVEPASEVKSKHRVLDPTGNTPLDAYLHQNDKASIGRYWLGLLDKDQRDALYSLGARTGLPKEALQRRDGEYQTPGSMKLLPKPQLGLQPKPQPKPKPVPAPEPYLKPPPPLDDPYGEVPASSIPSEIPEILGKHGTLDPYGQLGPQVPDNSPNLNPSSYKTPKVLPDHSDADNQWTYKDLPDTSVDKASPELASIDTSHIDPFGQLGPQVLSDPIATEEDNLVGESSAKSKPQVPSGSARKPSSKHKELPDTSVDKPSPELDGIDPDTMDPFGQLGPQIASDTTSSSHKPAKMPSYNDLPDTAVDQASPELDKIGTLDPFGQLGPQNAGTSNDDEGDTKGHWQMRRNSKRAPELRGFVWPSPEKIPSRPADPSPPLASIASSDADTKPSTPIMPAVETPTALPPNIISPPTTPSDAIPVSDDAAVASDAATDDSSWYTDPVADDYSATGDDSYDIDDFINDYFPSSSGVPAHADENAKSWEDIDLFGKTGNRFVDAIQLSPAELNEQLGDSGDVDDDIWGGED